LPPGGRIADKSTVGERADYFNARVQYWVLRSTAGSPIEPNPCCVIWFSPPLQAHVSLEKAGRGKVYQRLIQFPVREDHGIVTLVELHDQIIDQGNGYWIKI
jgi:hypothetical protein